MSEPTSRTTGWCWYCNARSIDYCKGGDEQGRCRFNDNPVTHAPTEPRTTPYWPRQSGRTTKQMQNAPPNACFVWCNDKRSYPLALARHIGRSDLTIISPEQDTDEFHRGRAWVVIHDHACSFR